jgi:REP-associated tyrosine transposase
MQNCRTRKQIRLRNYDYSTNGFYFITVCAKNRGCIFGDIPVGADGCPPADTIDVQLNDFGIIVDEELKKSPIIRKEIILDQYVVMPNHVHCIIIIENKDRDI